MIKKTLALIILILLWVSPITVGSQETSSNGLTIMYDTAFDKLNTNSTTVRSGLDGITNTVVDGSLDEISSDTDIVFAPGTLGVTETTLSSVTTWFNSGDKRLLIVSAASNLYSSDYYTSNDTNLILESVDATFTQFHDRQLYNELGYNDDNTTAQAERLYSEFTGDESFNFTNPDNEYNFIYPIHLTTENDEDLNMVNRDPKLGIVIMIARGTSSYISFGGNVSVDIGWTILMTLQEITDDHYVITMASPIDSIHLYNRIFNWFNNITVDLPVSSTYSNTLIFPFFMSIVSFIILIYYRKK